MPRNYVPMERLYQFVLMASGVPHEEINRRLEVEQKKIIAYGQTREIPMGSYDRMEKAYVPTIMKKMGNNFDWKPLIEHIEHPKSMTQMKDMK
jgi:hypothetical protein